MKRKNNILHFGTETKAEYDYCTPGAKIDTNSNVTKEK